LDWLLRIKPFPVLVTFHFSIHRTHWFWIGESHSPRSTQPNFFFCFKSTLLSDLRPDNHPILRITQDRRMFRFLLTVGVVLGIVAASETTSGNTTTTKALRIASVVIFLFLTVVQALQTCILATSSASGMRNLTMRVRFAE
jgi:hypothetical protein